MEHLSRLSTTFFLDSNYKQPHIISVLVWKPSYRQEENKNITVEAPSFRVHIDFVLMWCARLQSCCSLYWAILCVVAYCACVQPEFIEILNARNLHSHSACWCIWRKPGYQIIFTTHIVVKPDFAGGWNLRKSLDRFQSTRSWSICQSSFRRMDRKRMLSFADNPFEFLFSNCSYTMWCMSAHAN